MPECVLSHFGHVWLIANLGTIAYQAPLSMGCSRQQYWCGSPCPPPGDLPDPGIEPESLVSPALAGRFFTPLPLRKPFILHTTKKKELLRVSSHQWIRSISMTEEVFPLELSERQTIKHTAITKSISRIERDTCTPMFIAALLIIARTWKQPRCPSVYIKWMWGFTPRKAETKI